MQLNKMNVGVAKKSIQDAYDIELLFQSYDKILSILSFYLFLTD